MRCLSHLALPLLTLLACTDPRPPTPLTAREEPTSAKAEPALGTGALAYGSTADVRDSCYFVWRELLDDDTSVVVHRIDRLPRESLHESRKRLPTRHLRAGGGP